MWTISRVLFTYTRNLRASSLLFYFTLNLRVIYVCHTRSKNNLKHGLLVFSGGAVPFRTPFPTSDFTSSLPFCLRAICPSFVISFVMGVASAQREVLCFAGMGTVQRSPPRGVVVLLSYTQTRLGFPREIPRNSRAMAKFFT